MADLSRNTPPFRADHVGSLLRPAALAEARREFKAGRMAQQQLREIEDREIRNVIKMQEEVGLKGITDGEFRREYWHLDFLAGFRGIEIRKEYFNQAFSSGIVVPTPYTHDRISGHDGLMRDHIRFVAENTTQTAKLSIPGPGMTYLRGGRNSVSNEAYPDLEAFWSDLADAYVGEIRELGKAGCTYLQIDDVSFAYLCDENFRKGVIERGDDPDEMLAQFSRTTSRIAAGRPDGMTVTVHMCRGNNQSTWMTEGGYDKVAEIMFANLDVDGYFMEFDSDRAGGFEPLRFVPKGKIVVAGVVTSKFPELESVDEIKRRIDEAAKYMPLENLCLSPQCGFASTEEGNNLTPDEQRRKLERVVEAAEAIWG
ncbi:MAG: 5-methyltetrahydropteroyltriglutamate--homocysteine S-methyltransferase [Hyphomicrobiales bacterium]|nr:5-methyltetrahydropteroyltriglutamate--homocysteine S-methyltransferase [Hyphomicrobiales bacterium]